jgi:uncharacterized protein YjiS (DUF1127 family)
MLTLSAATVAKAKRQGLRCRKNVRLKMAYMNATRSAQMGFSDRFAALAAGLKNQIARRRVFNQTLFELSHLSDRDLQDLGLSRANITDVAREAAYKV